MVYNLEIHRRSCTWKIFEENLFHSICQNSKLKKNPSTLYHVDKLISAGLGIFLDLTAGIVPWMKSALLHCKVTRVLHNKNDAIERENQYLY